MRNILDEFLNVFWLRPETALWRTIDVKTMKNAILSGRSLDFGCGDGVFSFVRAGGTFESEFDVFKGASGLDKFFENEDVYNFSLTDHIKIKDKARYKISVGFDHKQALLNKANKLEFYDELVLGDGNKKLPFQDNEFDSIFSNIVYWLDDVDGVLRELNRIIRPDGDIYLMLPDLNLLASSFFYNLQTKRKVEGFEFLSYLDRGRVASNIKQAKSEDDWHAAITNAGFKVCNHSKHLSSRLLSVWDIGLRPLFPALNNACNRMSDEDRLAFKNDFIEVLQNFAHPLLALEIKDNVSDKGFHFFHLTK